MTHPVVHIIDDDEAVRRSLAALTRASGYAAATYAGARDFLEQMKAGEAGCIVTDIRMPGMSGLALMRELNRLGAPMAVVVISAHGDIPMAVQALKLGAVDFLEKPFDDTQYLKAVALALGQSRGLAKLTVLRAVAEVRSAQLTEREREVMDLIVNGHSNQAVASRLGISARTVENHRAKVMEKMAASGLSDLIRMALSLETQ